MKSEFSYEILEEIGVLSENAKGWTKELTKVSWNEREPKFDIRDWSPEYDKMGKGLTFSEEELRQLRDVLNKMDI